MEPSKTTQYYVAGGAAAIIIIVLAFFTVVRLHSKQMATDASKKLSDIVNATSTAALSVADQPAGSAVDVSGVSVNAFSWVAVREHDGSRVLGAARFLPGDTKGVVPLLRATEAGKIYEVVIYTDDGDLRFDMHKDALVDGVRATFTAR